MAVARAGLFHTVTDELGNATSGVSVTVKEADGVTAFSKSLYADPAGGSPLDPNTIASGANGLLELYTAHPQAAVISHGTTSYPVEFKIDAGNAMRAVYVTHTDYRADLTGAVDCKTAIETAIADASGTMCIIPPGTYRCDTAITIPTTVTDMVLWIQKGATLKGSDVLKLFDIRGDRITVILDGVVTRRGVATTTNACRAFDLSVVNDGAADFTLCGSGMIDDLGGVALYSNQPRTTVRDIRINNTGNKNLEGTHTSGDDAGGVWFTSDGSTQAIAAKVQNVRFTNIIASGVKLTDARTKGAVISGCQFIGTVTGDDLAMRNGVLDQGSTYTTIANNVFANIAGNPSGAPVGGEGIVMKGSFATIVGNQFYNEFADDGTTCAIDVQGSGYTVVQANVVDGTNITHALKLGGTTSTQRDVTVANNEFTDALIEFGQNRASRGVHFQGNTYSGTVPMVTGASVTATNITINGDSWDGYSDAASPVIAIPEAEMTGLRFRNMTAPGLFGRSNSFNRAHQIRHCSLNQASGTLRAVIFGSVDSWSSSQADNWVFEDNHFGETPWTTSSTVGVTPLTVNPPLLTGTISAALANNDTFDFGWAQSSDGVGGNAPIGVYAILVLRNTSDVEEMVEVTMLKGGSTPSIGFRSIDDNGSTLTSSAKFAAMAGLSDDQVRIRYTNDTGGVIRLAGYVRSFGR